MASSSNIVRKRQLNSKDASKRADAAKQALEEKYIENSSDDKSKHFVACFECIQNGFVSTRGLQLVIRRDRLQEHFHKNHPGHVVQEWRFTSSIPNKRQLTMFTMFEPKQNDDQTNPNDEIQMTVKIDTDNGEVPEDDETAEVAGTSKDIHMTEDIYTGPKLQETTSIGDNDSKNSSGSGIEWGFNTIIKISKGVWTLINLVTESYKLIKLIAHKHGVTDKCKEVERDYGSYVHLENGALEFDDDKLKRDVASCKNTTHLMFQLPFLAIAETILSIEDTENNDGAEVLSSNEKQMADDEDEQSVKEYLTCSYCPDTKISYYQDHMGSKRFGNTKTSVQKHALSNKHKENVGKTYKTHKDEIVAMSKDRSAATVVFRTVYGGLKQGYSFSQIIRELSVLQYHDIEVGSLKPL